MTDVVPIVGQGRLFAAPQERTTSDDFYTPREVFDRLGLTFDLDVCSPPGGIPWVPAARYYTMADDGLTAPWEGRVWMNPPYSNPTPWVRRFIAHRHGICLVPHAKSAWHVALWESGEGCVSLGPSFSQFVGGAIFMPVWLTAFGEECVEALSRLGTVRTIRRFD